MLTAEERAFYSSDIAEENRHQIRIDPNRPGFIRADEDEAADEFEEDVGLSKAGVKRKHVRTDAGFLLVSELIHQQGYDSDSSQEGDKKKKSKKAAKRNNDDDDMFAEKPPPPPPPGGDAQEQPKDELEEEDEYGKLKPKKIKFVDINNIEGQEFSDEEKDVEDEEESLPSTPNDSDEEELDEEVGLAGSKKHAPKIERFNLKQEQAEGAFTADGGYIRKAADPRAHQDVWLEGLTKGAVARAVKAAEKQREREREAERRQEEEEQAFSPTQRLEMLIRALRPRETPFDALARLNHDKKKKWQPSQKWKKSKMAVDETTEDAKEEEDPVKLKEQIEMITAAADKLLALGTMNIYSLARERLIMLYQDEAGERFRENAQVGGDSKWEYKWPGTDEVYSDFTSENMRGWKADGFFGDGVLVRRAGSQDEWKDSTEIEF